MGELETRIWEFLPARADRRRTTITAVIASNIGETVGETAAVLHAMEARRHVVRGRRGSWHRGMPLPDPSPGPEQEGLW